MRVFIGFYINKSPHLEKYKRVERTFVQISEFPSTFSPPRD